MKKKKITNALEILKNRYAKNNPTLEASIEQELINSQVAQMIYKIRTDKGITQKELAKRINTTQSVISRLEDSDYKGHSLAMLQKISISLGSKINITFADENVNTKNAEIEGLKSIIHKLREDLLNATRRIEIKVDQGNKEITELRMSNTSDTNLENRYDVIRTPSKLLNS
jgi:transcriptional regulator with XRE-family HTH domain